MFSLMLAGIKVYMAKPLPAAGEAFNLIQPVMIGLSGLCIGHHAASINPANLVEFASVAEARAAGYVPCGTCTPPR